jgi:hypothetical protein
MRLAAHSSDGCLPALRMAPTMRKNAVPRIVVSVVALVAAGVHMWMPTLTIDSVTIALLVIAAVPWLQPLIRSIELLGVKLELQELQSKVAEAQGAAASATRQAGLALASGVSPGGETFASDTAGGINALAQEYNHIRETQRPGDARTAAMTSVVRRMIEAASSVQEFDVDAALQEANRGLRLFAYAYLYARPDPRWLSPLVASVTIKEDKPFGQYWGLQAIGRVQANAAPNVLREAKDKLLAFGAKVPPGTDRDYEIKSVVRQIDQVTRD